MSDLRVTDVQAALRHFQSVGHDVMTNPRMLNLEGREYGLAALHHLSVLKDNRGDLLHSYLMQSERPLLSEVHTQSFEPEDGIQRISRFVQPHQPRMHTNTKTGTSYHGYESNSYVTDPGSWGDDSYAPVGSVLWTPDTFWTQGPHKDIHEALESHRSADVSHTGTVITDGSYKNARAMDSADRFNNKEALANTLPRGDIFKGLVSVTHSLPNNKSARYTYNPDTEQLFKHED
jgi:hypothetical protein